MIRFGFDVNQGRRATDQRCLRELDAPNPPLFLHPIINLRQQRACRFVRCLLRNQLPLKHPPQYGLPLGVCQVDIDCIR